MLAPGRHSATMPTKEKLGKLRHGFVFTEKLAGEHLQFHPSSRPARSMREHGFWRNIMRQITLCYLKMLLHRTQECGCTGYQNPHL